MYMISLLHYNAESDIVIMIVSNVFGDEKQKSTRILEFPLAYAISIGKEKPIDKIEISPYMRSNRYEKVVRTMIHLHKHENGNFFICTETGYYTMIKASNTPGAKYLISDMKFWRDVKGMIPMADCLAVKPTQQDGIYMFVENNKVIPITFLEDTVV